MKHKTIIALPLLSQLLFSCANQDGGEDYDVANPYAAANYSNETGTPNLPSDVNPAYEETAVYEDTTPTPSVPDAPSPTAQARVHTVVRGDSLWSISKKYGVSIDAIKQANGMTKDIAVLGAKLNIPAQ
jgi:LysM repeat protein